MTMTTKPKTRKAPAANGAELDPVFAAIAEHKALIKESTRCYDKLDKAEFEAGKTHGKRPSRMIGWRNHSMIVAEYEIDNARKGFLSHPAPIKSKSRRNTWTRRRGWPLPSMQASNGIIARASRHCASKTNAPRPLSAARLCEWPGRNRRRRLARLP